MKYLLSPHRSLTPSLQEFSLPFSIADYTTMNGLAELLEWDAIPVGSSCVVLSVSSFPFGHVRYVTHVARWASAPISGNIPVQILSLTQPLIFTHQ